VFLLACSLGANGQAFLRVDTSEYIEWNEGRPLQWSDFVYKPLEAGNKDYFALTTVFHSVRGGMKNGKPNFQVRVLYVKKESWTTNVRSNDLLDHEKLHFDLAELYGRKLRKQIEEMGKAGEKDISKYSATIKLLLDEFKRKSSIYDTETLHGRDFEQQEVWNEFVKYELNRLNKYKYVYNNK